MFSSWRGRALGRHSVLVAQHVLLAGNDAGTEEAERVQLLRASFGTLAVAAKEALGLGFNGAATYGSDIVVADVFLLL